MFEDSTFESTGRIKTRSRRWMIATFSMNGLIVLALVLIPLVFPNALPHPAMQFLVVAPAAPTTPANQTLPQRLRASHDLSEIEDGHLIAPTNIPILIKISTKPEAPFASTALTMEFGTCGSERR